jgi:hypothetical protein
VSERRYRTPGNSEFVEALGWCVWNFLYLEEKIIRWLWLMKPETSLNEWRKETAFGKGVVLGREVKHSNLPAELRRDMKAWVTRYQEAVTDVRNVVAHGHAFTAGQGPEGWLPGLAYTDPDGRGSITAQSPEDLHLVAERIEALMLDLSGMEPRLQETLNAPPVRPQIGP